MGQGPTAEAPSVPVRVRRRAWAVGVVAVVAVLSPLAGSEADSFPLSSYPMFSHDRGRTADVHTVVAVDAAGARRRLSPEVIAGNDEPMLAIKTVGRAVSGGPGTAARLCQEAAGRLGPSPEGWPIGRATVEVVTERHDALDYLAGDEEPLSVAVHARCPAGAR